MKAALIRLYPARWRRRYGDEFEQLLEDRKLGPIDVLDVALGAIDARLRAASASFGGLGDPTTRPRRVAGLAAIAGGLVWLSALAAVLGVGQGSDEAGPLVFGLVAVGSALLLVALIGLTAFEAREDRAVAWMAVSVPAAGCVATIGGGLALAFVGGSDEVGYGAFILGAFALVAGSAFVAIVAAQTGTLSRRAARFLAAASTLFVVGLAVGLSVPIVLAVSWAGFSVAWINVGIDAMGRDRRSESPQPTP